MSPPLDAIPSRDIVADGQGFMIEVRIDGGGP